MTLGRKGDDGVPTLPNVCGLLMALPTTLSSVQSAFAGGSYSDYVSRGGTSADAPALWKGGFAKVASAARSLSQKAAALGVMVIENATLGDVTRMFSARSVVTLVAHWRGPQVSKNDILADPGPIAYRLANEQSAFASLFRAGEAIAPHDLVGHAGTDSIRRSRLAEVIDRRLSRFPPLVPAPAGTEWSLDYLTLRHLNRAALDDWSPESFKSGNRLELYDGLHSVGSIAAAVPAEWAGIADLSNCQSAQLIQSIKGGRSDRVIIANERETNPIRRMALLTCIYDVLSRGSVSYLEARKAMAAQMVKEWGGQYENA